MISVVISPCRALVTTGWKASREAFAPVVRAAGLGEITTEIAKAGPYYYAEDYHQQYLSDAKNPYGYCNHGPNGMTCPIGVAKTA